MSTLSRHLRVTRTAFVQSVGRDTQFRAQTWTTVVVGLVEVVLGLVPALLVFSHTDQVNGWNIGLVLAVAGTFQVLLSILGAFVQPNQAKMTGYIRRGELDGVLIRPVSPQLYAAFRWMQPAELWSGLAGLVLLIIGLHRAGDPAGSRRRGGRARLVRGRVGARHPGVDEPGLPGRSGWSRWTR